MMNGNATVEGDIDALPMWAGQGVGLVKKIQPAAEIVREIYVEAHSILMRFGTLAAELQPREGCIRSQDSTD